MRSFINTQNILPSKDQNPDLKGSSWICSLCTLKNESKDNFCSLCRCEREIAQSISSISCPSCTFLNKSNSLYCDICQKPLREKISNSEKNKKSNLEIDGIKTRAGKRSLEFEGSNIKSLLYSKGDQIVSTNIAIDENSKSEIEDDEVDEDDEDSDNSESTYSDDYSITMEEENVSEPEFVHHFIDKNNGDENNNDEIEEIYFSDSNNLSEKIPNTGPLKKENFPKELEPTFPSISQHFW